MFARIFPPKLMEIEAIKINIENIKISIYGECKLTQAYLANRNEYQQKQLLNASTKYIQDRISSLADYISTFKKPIIDDVISYKKLYLTTAMPESAEQTFKTLEMLEKFEKELQALKRILHQMKVNELNKKNNDIDNKQESLEQELVTEQQSSAYKRT